MQEFEPTQEQVSKIPVDGLAARGYKELERDAIEMSTELEVIKMMQKAAQVMEPNQNIDLSQK